MSVRTDVVNLIVNVGGDAAKNELNQLRKSAADIAAEMKLMSKNTVEYKNKAAELASVNKQMDALKGKIGIASLSLKELYAEQKKLNMLFAQSTMGTPEYARLKKELDAVKNRIYEVKNNVTGFSASIMKLKNDIGSMATATLGIAAAMMVVQKFMQLVTASGKISDQLADLQRVAGLSATEARNLNNELKQIDTRTSVEGLRQIAIIAGKLGVAKNDIAGFTQAVDMLVVSLGDELGSADEITTQLGKILNVFDGKVTGDNITTLGNAIVVLANAGVASGPFITDFSQRVSGIAVAANLSLGATVGLAAGFEELGLRSESSSGALQNILAKISTDLPTAAKIANIPLAQFNDLFSSKPQEALIKYAEGLVRNKNSFAEVSASFADADEKGLRVTQTLQAIGQRGDFLREKINLGAEAMKSSTAITEAFALKNENMGAKLDKIWKRIESIFTSGILYNAINGIVDLFGKLVGVTDNIDTNLAEFKAQADKVNKLEKEMVPLLDRYDELKKKTSLSKDEQVELNKTITAIALNIPSAITEFDKYGKAIGVSTEQAREFIKIQQLIFKEKNRDAIKDQQDALDKLEKDLALAQHQQEQMTKANAVFMKSVQFMADNNWALTDNMNKEMDFYTKGLASGSAYIQGLQDRITGKKGIIANLNGEDLGKGIDKIAPAGGGGGILETPEEKAAREKAEKEAKKAREKADKAALDALKKLNAKILEEADALEVALMGKDEAEIHRIHKKYAALLAEAVGHSAQILQLQALETKETAQYLRKSEKEKAGIIQKFLSDVKELEDEAAKKKKKADKKAIASWAENALNAQIEANKHNSEVLQNRQDREKKHNKELLQNAEQLISDLANLWSLAAAYADQRDQQQLDKELAANEKKKNSYTALLNAKKISQATYDAAIAKIENQSEARRHEAAIRQARRHKALSITQSLINVAEGITKAIAQGGFLGLITGAIVGAAGAIQIASILDQEVPTGRKGLIVDGPSHEGGGVDLVDHNTGRVKANVEGGEPLLVLSKNTYGNNKDIIDSLLYSSQQLGGAPISPTWSRSFSNIAPSVAPMLANGGIVGNTSSSGSMQGVEQLLSHVLQAQQQQNMLLASMPTNLKAHVVYKEIITADSTMNTIRRQSGLNQ